MQEKHLLKSKTIVGALLTILPVVLPLLGINFSAEDYALFGETADKAIQLFGGLMAVWGRVVAQTKLKL